MEGRDVEIPQYFLCPISLQLMRDPVTTVTGITYERESIEKWLSKSSSSGLATCPVTNQPLPRDSGLTPNHTLLRLIQAWCVGNAKNGVDQIPTPKSPLDRGRVRKLVKELAAEHSIVEVMKELKGLVEESERNRACMVEAGVANAMVEAIIKCFRQSDTTCLGEALRILHSIWSPTAELKDLVKENCYFVDSLAWALHFRTGYNGVESKTHALAIMKNVMEIANVSLKERLKLDLFKSLVKILRDTRMSQQGIKSALLVLIEACPLGRNRHKMIEAGVIFELVELELGKPEKRVSELAFNLLAQLCSCADGRAQLLRHAGGIAMITKRTLRVSPAVDDKALQVLALVSKFSPTGEVVMEMLRVGAVSKLCMVLQADCPAYLKSKARAVLRMHSNVWNNSPCIQVYLLTRYPR
ncbi:E3 ubiquitin-protein ligase PUB24-like [Eucalyptus grandis]|uniref:E3 ubiquitin-protein ligase PUB24-like n=1 Tax=Eucalyptus grandis TaxID=71139 RepID=UPI00192EB149|nr:E3 ubiquitin-protein ligase PUB24-like [Eucalyptus grandis]